jgi:hypothetical protein
MVAIHLRRTTTAAPEQFLAALTNFGPGREKVFPLSTDGYLKVHVQGPGRADVTEGSAAFWERLRYDWSDPAYIKATTLDSNVWGRTSRHAYTLTREPDGTTTVDILAVREGKNLKGRLLEALFVLAGKRILGTRWDVTIKAIEAAARLGLSTYGP